MFASRGLTQTLPKRSTRLGVGGGAWVPRQGLHSDLAWRPSEVSPRTPDMGPPPDHLHTYSTVYVGHLGMARRASCQGTIDDHTETSWHPFFKLCTAVIITVVKRDQRAIERTRTTTHTHTHMHICTYAHTYTSSSAVRMVYLGRHAILDRFAWAAQCSIYLARLLEHPQRENGTGRLLPQTPAFSDLSTTVYVSLLPGVGRDQSRRTAE